MLSSAASTSAQPQVEQLLHGSMFAGPSQDRSPSDALESNDTEERASAEDASDESCSIKDDLPCSSSSTLPTPNVLVGCTDNALVAPASDPPASPHTPADTEATTLLDTEALSLPDCSDVTPLEGPVPDAPVDASAEGSYYASQPVAGSFPSPHVAYDYSCWGEEYWGWLRGEWSEAYCLHTVMWGTQGGWGDAEWDAFRQSSPDDGELIDAYWAHWHEHGWPTAPLPAEGEPLVAGGWATADWLASMSAATDVSPAQEEGSPDISITRKDAGAMGLEDFIGGPEDGFGAPEVHEGDTAEGHPVRGIEGPDDGIGGLEDGVAGSEDGAVEAVDCISGGEHGLGGVEVQEDDTAGGGPVDSMPGPEDDIGGKEDSEDASETRGSQMQSTADAGRDEECSAPLPTAESSGVGDGGDVPAAPDMADDRFSLPGEGDTCSALVTTCSRGVPRAFTADTVSVACGRVVSLSLR